MFGRPTSLQGAVRRQKGDAVSSGYIPAKDEPDPDEILEALREAIFDNPRLIEMPSEEQRQVQERVEEQRHQGLKEE